MIERDWYIDIFPKIEIITRTNYNRTRKNRKLIGNNK
jgi:hypothetical protein